MVLYQHNYQHSEEHMPVSEEILNDLTDEEREAILEAEREDAEAAAAGKKDDDEPPTDEQKNDQDGEGATQGADKDDAEGKDKDDAGDGGDNGASDGNDAGKDGAGDDAGADDKPAAQQPAPLLVAEAPADAEARLAAIDGKKGALLEQFDNGDITAKEYQTQLDALNKEERSIERAVEKAQLAAEIRQQQEVNNWMAQVQSFTTKDHPEYSTSKVRWMALDAFVKEIGSKPENASLSGAQILAEAHKRVVEDLGEAPAKAGTKDAKSTTRPLKGSSEKPPTTLSKVPAADNTDVENGRWAAMDRLYETDPVAAEEKMMKWSESERDAYLARR
jgi:hypothetical protein